MSQCRLQGIVQAQQPLATLVIQQSLGVQPLRRLETKPVVSLVCIEVQQVLFHASHGSVDGHVIVVEDDQQVIGLAGDIVQSFKCKTAAHRSVADDGHDMPVLLRQLGRNGHPQSGRNGVGGMAAGESVVNALDRRRERHQSVQLAVVAEAVPPSCQDLMAVGLMADIPYEAVFRRMEDVMACHRDLGRSQAGSEVSRIDSDFLNDVLPQLLAEHRKVVQLQSAQIGR